MIARIFTIVFVLLGLAACSTYSSSSVTPIASYESEGAQPSNPTSILVMEGDITDRAYTVLGDIKVTVNKTTIFNKDPSRALVDEELREKAAKMGANAVIMVRYGTVGVSMMSWGSLDGQGRAIKFN